MDAKTAVKILNNSAMYLKPISNGQCKEIAVLIGQQEAESAALIDENGQQHIEITLLSRKNEQQEKFAKLGRLALTTRANVCSNTEFSRRANLCENHCVNYGYCKYRAELLAGECEHYKNYPVFKCNNCKTLPDCRSRKIAEGCKNE